MAKNTYMKLLLVTQTIDRNDPILGFFHAWVEEFARHTERVEVICLSEGVHRLPANVHVHSLGKEQHPPQLFRKFLFTLRFWQLVVRLRSNYDTVLVHMNPEYLLLGGVYWRLSQKKVGLWYVHKRVSWRLRAATMLANIIFTASIESFRLVTPKVRVVGHGIDLSPWVNIRRTQSETLRLLTVGRIGGAKHIKEMLGVLEALERRGVPARLSIVGAGVTNVERQYEEEVRQAAARFGDAVQFAGPLPQEAVPAYLRDADVFLHLSTTGSLDKAVLEALIAGLPVVSNSEAFMDLLKPYGLFVSPVDSESLAERVRLAKNTDISVLAEKIKATHALPTLITRIVQEFSKP